MKKFDLDTPLIQFSGNDSISSFTIRDAVEGVQIFGGIGSGKTSGSGRMLALNYLANGFGGLVLSAKADEKKMWQEYCRITNRSNDLIVIEPGGKHYFNFLEYESSDSGKESSITGNLVEVLKTVIRASQEKNSGKSDDAFWETALDMLIFNVLDLCMLAYGKASIHEIFDIVLSAPKTTDSKTAQDKNANERKSAFKKAFKAARENINKQIEEWRNGLSPDEITRLDDPETFEQEVLDSVPDASLLRFVDQFFIENYRNIGEKTRSIIEFSFTGFLFRLLKDPFYSLFCRYPSTVTPDDCLDGKIILLNLPVKKYHKVGRDIQIMFKYIWQRSMEKRQIDVNDRPVFLWADEAQNFLHEHDAEYQATARSSMIATVYISQNLPNYHANMGGEKSAFRVKSFLGTLGTKIFHTNADLDTNEYASQLIGDAYINDDSESVTLAGSFSSTRSTSLKLERVVRPEGFVSLKTGGPLNDYRVQGYMHRQGKTFQDGLNFKAITFNQNYNPKTKNITS